MVEIDLDHRVTLVDAVADLTGVLEPMLADELERLVARFPPVASEARRSIRSP